MAKSQNNQTDQDKGRKNPLFDFASERAASDQELKDAYLSAYAEVGQVGKACMMSGVSRNQVTRWREIDPAFNTRLYDIHQANVDMVESTVFEIATDGEAPYGARIAAAKLYLEANRPEVYKPQAGDAARHATQINLILGMPPKEALPETTTRTIDTKAKP